MPRCFLAVRVPAHRSLADLIRQLDQIGRTVRGVRPDGIHITLKFLGETRLEDIAPITRSLQSGLQDIPPADVQIRGVGGFPSPRRPRVVWAGVEPELPLQELARICEAACQPLGYPGEARGFQPHITLARIEGGPPQELSALVAEHAATSFGPLPIAAVELLQSDHGPSGPRYTTLATLRLRARRSTRRPTGRSIPTKSRRRFRDLILFEPFSD